jgi:hypothetical protein
LAVGADTGLPGAAGYIGDTGGDACIGIVYLAIAVVVEAVSADLGDGITGLLAYRRTKRAFRTRGKTGRADARFPRAAGRIGGTGDRAYIRVIHLAIAIVVQTVIADLGDRIAGLLAHRCTKRAVGTRGKTGRADARFPRAAGRIGGTGDGAYIRVIGLSITVVVKAVVAYLRGWSHADLRKHKVAVKAGLNFGLTDANIRACKNVRDVVVCIAIAIVIQGVTDLSSRRHSNLRDHEGTVNTGLYFRLAGTDI